MGLLNRKSLLEKQELQTQKVDLGDDYIYVREMTGRERDNFERSLRKQVKRGDKTDYEVSLEDFRAKLVVNTACDEKGDAIFQPSDYSMLSKNISAKRLMTIADAASELNGITEDDREDMVKNSEAAPSGNSSSASAES